MFKVSWNKGCIHPAETHYRSALLTLLSHEVSGMTQDDAAKLLGIHQSDLNRMLCRRNIPRLGRLIHLLGKLGYKVTIEATK
jgi:hypothetical protein